MFGESRRLNPAATNAPGGVLRLCYVCNEYPDFPHGGLGVVTRLLSRALRERGHEVRVVGAYAGLSSIERQDDRGVSVFRLPRVEGPGGWIRTRRRMYQLISSWAARDEIDLVEVPDWEGWAAGWPSLPVPVVARIHGSGVVIANASGRRAPRMTRFLEGVSLRRADARCAASRFIAQATEGAFHLTRGRTEILYNPVEDPGESADGPRSAEDVVFAGTLNANKGIVTVLEAWPRVIQARPLARLHVYGRDTEGPEGFNRASLSAHVPEPFRSTVTFHGHVGRSVVQEAFRRAAVAVFPSLVEAFALAPLEAMSLGCPTVYTERGSGPELIENGKHGLLIDPRSPSQISTAILRVLGDRTLAQELGRAGRERARSFFLPAMIPTNEAFYFDALRRFRHVH